MAGRPISLLILLVPSPRLELRILAGYICSNVDIFEEYVHLVFSPYYCQQAFNCLGYIKKYADSGTPAGYKNGTVRSLHPSQAAQLASLTPGKVNVV